MLADIELAQTLQAAGEEEEKVEEVPHPLDRNYQLLKCQLQLLDPEAPEYKVGWDPGAAKLAVSTTPLPICPPDTQRRPLPWPSLPMSLWIEERSGTGDKRGLIHTSLALGTQLLLPLQVIRTYLQQTGSYRCPTLQHVWKVNREGEVRQSPPLVTSLPCHHPHS